MKVWSKRLCSETGGMLRFLDVAGFPYSCVCLLALGCRTRGLVLSVCDQVICAELIFVGEGR